MLNVAQTIRFVVENPEVRWSNLTERERAICSERMRPFLLAWPADIQAEFRSAMQSSPDKKYRDLLLQMADDIEEQDEKLKHKVPPRSFTRANDKTTLSTKSLFPPTREGAEDHKRFSSTGGRT